MLTIIKRLLDTGILLGQIRPVIAYLRGRPLKELPALMVMSDGEKIYPSPEPDEAAKLLATGLGVFGVTPGRIWAEVDSALMELPGERPSRSAS